VYGSFLTKEENFLIDSAVGKPAILGESVSKYSEKDCSFASWIEKVSTTMVIYKINDQLYE
jgi:hypothetical protein